jgi:hypothetical protein
MITYFDAVASGRFTRVGERWAFYPWGERRGYLLPSREHHWRLHAWTAKVVKLWLLLTAGLWILLGPVSVPLAGVPILAWCQVRVSSVLAGLPRTETRRARLDGHRARAEAHSWRALWFTAAVSLLGTAAASTTAVAIPELLVSSLVAGVAFAIPLGGATLMIRFKTLSERRESSFATV